MRLEQRLTFLTVFTLASGWGAQALAEQPVQVSLRPTASGVCKCDLSRKTYRNGYVMTPGSKFQGTRAVEARIQNLEASGVDLARADFSFALLTNARFTGAILREAVFREARLPKADFTRAELAGADFTGAQLQGADLATALHLTQGQLEGACGDGDTRLPPGLRLPLCVDALPEADDEGPGEAAKPEEQIAVVDLER